MCYKMTQNSTIEFHRVIYPSHSLSSELIRALSPETEVFYCPLVSSMLIDSATPYDNADHHIFRINYDWHKRLEDRVINTAYVLDIIVLNMLDDCYNKLIKDEQFAIYKEEMIQWYIRINLLSERIMPDVIYHMKTLI